MVLAMRDPNASVQPGLNCTVRRGVKWLAAVPGTPLTIIRSGPGEFQDRIITSAVSIGATSYDSFEKIPAGLVVKFQRDEAIKTAADLRELLVSTYGEIDGSQFVVLFFWAA